MTIEDYIDKFFLARTFDKNFDFTGYQLTSYVRTYIPHVTEEGIKRKLRKLKQFDRIDYEHASDSQYRIVPKRRNT
ncbi:MAG: hypothetical protein ACXV2C_00530 [Candidatus Bathyarchaeia archaeon]